MAANKLLFDHLPRRRTKLSVHLHPSDLSSGYDDHKLAVGWPSSPAFFFRGRKGGPEKRRAKAKASRELVADMSLRPSKSDPDSLIPYISLFFSFSFSMY